MAGLYGRQARTYLGAEASEPRVKEVGPRARHAWEIFEQMRLGAALVTGRLVEDPGVASERSGARASLRIVAPAPSEADRPGVQGRAPLSQAQSYGVYQIGEV